MIRNGKAYCDECKGVITKDGVAVDGRLFCAECEGVYRRAVPGYRRTSYDSIRSIPSYVMGVLVAIVSGGFLAWALTDGQQADVIASFGLLLLSLILIQVSRS